jgi:hypothetical protein
MNITLHRRFGILLFAAFCIPIFILVFGILLSPALGKDADDDRISIREHYDIIGIEGDTVSQVLASSDLLGKIRPEALALLGIQLDSKALDAKRRYTWLDTDLIWINSILNNGNSARYAFDRDTGHLERFREEASIEIPGIRQLSDEEIAGHLIAPEQALSAIRDLLDLLGLEQEIKPEKLTPPCLPNDNTGSVQWYYKYYDVPEYHGILSRSSLFFSIHPLTGKIFGFALYNAYIPPPEKTDIKISDASAMEIAKTWCGEKGFSVAEETPRLLYAPASNIWSAARKRESYVQDNHFRLCWRVKLVRPESADPRPCASVEIDVTTGEVVAGYDNGIYVTAL